MTDFLLFLLTMCGSWAGAAIGYIKGSRLIHVVIGNALGYSVGVAVLLILIACGVV